MTETIPAVDRSPQDRSASLLQSAILIAMLLAIVAVMLGPVHRLPLRLPEDENEGWNAYYALAAMLGGVLYPPTDSFITNNYPPLSFYLIGLLGKGVHDYVVAGRLVALASELVVALNIYWLIRRFRGERFVAMFAAALFLLYIATNLPYYVAMDDPEWLAHAFTTAGAVAFFRTWDGSRSLGGLLLSSALCVAGVFVKHTVIVLPFALFVWSAWCDRRRLLLWTIVGLGLGTGALLLTIHAHGLVFLQDVFEHKRQLSGAKTLQDAGRFIAPFAPLLLYAVLLGALSWSERGVKFLLLYAVLAAAFGLFCLAGTGIDANVLFDLIIALCIASGLLASRAVRLFATPYQSRASAVVALAIATVCLPASARALAHSRLWVQQDHGERQHYQQLIDQLAAASGPVVCEQPSLCYWAGKPFDLDFFNYGQKVQTHAVDPSPLRESLERRKFTYVETVGSPEEVNSFTSKLLGDDLTRRLTEHYVVVRQVGEEFLLAPRR